MNAIARRITGTPAGSPHEMALRIKREAPTLADLDNDQLEQIARLVMTQRLASELNAKVDLAGIDYANERKTFLNNAGKTHSAHTRIAYNAGLDRLEEFCNVQGINVLELSPAQADDFIYFLRNETNRKTGKENSPATVRIIVAAASSFFTKLHRRNKSIDNPFWGTDARPGKEAKRKFAIPTAAEVEIIVSELPAYESAAVAVMAYRGLRAGALPTLSITGGRFFGFSKGKDISGIMPESALNAIRAAMLPMRGPFADILPNSLEKRIARAIEKLRKEGKVQAGYSCHDLRHFFAVTEYRKDKDIHRVSRLLGHSSIQVTENYLKGLGEVE